jgi:hypothetical protein
MMGRRQSRGQDGQRDAPPLCFVAPAALCARLPLSRPGPELKRALSSQSERKKGRAQNVKAEVRETGEHVANVAAGS